MWQNRKAHLFLGKEHVTLTVLWNEWPLLEPAIGANRGFVLPAHFPPSLIQSVQGN